MPKKAQAQAKPVLEDLRHPIQPLGTTPDNVVRFKSNAIVRFLLDHGGFDMNKLAGMNFTAEDHMQFAQLIGYSLSGYSELSYVSDESYGAAAAMAEGQPETEARITQLTETITRLREGLREPIAALYGIHPDDLKRGF